WEESGLVLTTERGTAVDGNWITKNFIRKLKELALPRVRFHDLRHTQATLLLKKGVHPKVVQERLGHSSINITMDTYSHVLPGMQKEAALVLDSLFTGAAKTDHA
ncbi:MAG TPA: site-specific integrase, partial [Firmicutes bacterium]|nr:site-specific integrase [Bacillota bacterium]